MAAKVSPTSSEEQFLLWANAIKYNTDIMAELDYDGVPWFFIRLRPWKQDKRTPIMHTGAGRTLVEAMRAVLYDYTDGEEKGLDYAYRPWRVATTSVPTPNL